MRGATWRRLSWAAAAAAAGAVGLALLMRRGDERAYCGAGFYAVDARCCPGPAARAGTCLPAPTCPPPLRSFSWGCDAPDQRVPVPETTLQFGASDWEAEGRVAARLVHVPAFEIDAFEATLGHLSGGRAVDPPRAASGLTRAAAEAYCNRRGGRLPTEDEWLVAAAGPGGTRYPWGETGAVCRRAAWGLASGPCASGATGPDTVGAHASGDSPSGIHDMAGNVSEWVAPGADRSVGVACGGSWKAALAAELRTWSRLELDPDAQDERVGVRCAYDAH